MRVQIIADCYLPSTKSSAKLIHDLGVEFRRQGHDVCIAAPDDSLVSGRVINREEGMTVMRVHSGKMKGTSKYLRGFHESRLSALLWNSCRDVFETHPADLIVFYSPSIFFGALVGRLKRLWGCPAYLVLRDIFPQWAIDAGVLGKGPAYWFFCRKELDQYAVADVIGVQSAANLNYFRDHGWDKRYRLDVLYNWTTLDEQDVPATNFREQWGLQNQIVFFYGGNIGVAQDMDNVVRLADSLRDEPDVHFLLVGDGSEVARLQADVAARGLTNISLRPAVGQREYLGMLSEFDVGLVTLDRHLKTQNFPGKMLGYMYYSKPILASINPGNDLRDVVEQANCGLVCENGDDAELRERALRLARDAMLRQRIGRNGRRLLEDKFAVPRTVQQILTAVGLDHAAPAAMPRAA
ncbi:MAG: glycosyltransferase family 4 protein [Planctomycetales bacterium]|nr:glycosyltransferase family 4 protein [Planctomycetales bacterium]